MTQGRKLSRLLAKIIVRERDRREYGHLHENPDLIEVAERPDYVRVVMETGTHTQALNIGAGQVALRANLAVQMIRLHSGELLMDGVDLRLMQGDVNVPGNPYGVPPHPFFVHTDVPSDYIGDAGKVVEVSPDEDGLVFVAPINVSAGAADAGKLVKLDAGGQVDATMVNDGDIDHTLITNIGTNTHAQVDTHIAATAAHGATGAVVGTTNTQTLSGKTLTAPVIADFTNAAHDHGDADDGGGIVAGAIPATFVGDRIHAATDKATPVDADELGLSDSAASFVLKKLTWANLKAAIKTYYDAVTSTMTNKTLTTPTISATGFANANHAHAAANSGGQIAYSALTGLPTLYTDEAAQDAVGAMLVDTATIDLAYVDATPALTATVIDASITNAKLANMVQATVKGRADAAGTGAPVDLTKAQLLTLLNVADGANAYVHPNHTGDVTSTGDGATVIGANKVLTAMIADAQLTLAKMANLAADTIIGRANGAGTGVPTALTATQVRTIINVASGADVTGTAIAALAAKTTPVDADAVVITDSTASDAPKRTLWSNIKATLMTYFDRLYIWAAGKGGGQTLNGGTAASENLTLLSTAHATKGKILFGTLSAYDEVNDRWGFGTQSPTVKMMLVEAVDGGEALINVDNSISTAGSIDEFAGIQFLHNGGAAAKMLAGREEDFVGGANRTSFLSLHVRLNGAYLEAMRIVSSGVVAVGLTAVGASVLGVKAGTSTNDAAVGGVLYVDSGTHGNGTTVETDLASYSVPANTLSANNMSLEFEAWGTAVNNSNTKTLKLYFGADVWTILTSGAGAGAISWLVRVRIIRTGAATQDIVIELIHSGTLTFGPDIVISTATRTLSSANTLKLTGQSSVASNDVVQQGFIVKWSDANT